MYSLLVLVVGAMAAAAVYLMLRGDALGLALGVILLGTAVNLLVFTAGRPAGDAPPLIPQGAYAPTRAIADPLPQALVLTALVIGSGMAAWLLALLRRAAEEDPR